MPQLSARREIGVRIPMGATRLKVIGLVVSEVLWLIGAGLAAGVPLSLFLAQAIRSQLFGVSRHDLPTLVLVCLMILAVAFASAVLAARRAARVDPIAALRYE